MAGFTAEILTQLLSKAGQNVNPKAAMDVVQNVIPKVAADAQAGQKIIDAIPSRKMADPVAQASRDMFRRIQSGDDVTKVFKQRVGQAAPTGASALTDDVATELKETFGYSPAVLRALAESGVDEATISNVKSFALESATEAQRLAQEVIEKVPGSAEALLKQIDVTTKIMDQVGGTNRAFRQLQVGPGGSIDVVRDAVKADTLFAARLQGSANMEDFARVVIASKPEELVKMANKMGVPSWKGAIRELYYNNLLSRPKTMVKNAVSGVLNAGVNVAERYVAAGVGSMSKNGVHTFSDANNLLLGYFAGFRQAMLTGKNALGGNVLERWAGFEPTDTSGKVLGQFGATAFGLNPNSAVGKTANFVGKHMRKPTDVLRGTDSFMKEWTYQAELYAMMRKEASLAENPTEALAALIRDVPDEMMEKARTQGLVMTHTEDLWNKWDEGGMNQGGTQAFQQIGRVADALSRAKENSWVLTLTMPFVKTSANALRFNLERFPGVNALSSRFRADWSGVNGQAARELAIAKTLMGGTVLGGVAIMAANMEITGAAPRDPELRASWLAAHPEYGVNFLGHWITYNPDSTLGLLLATGANFGQALGSDHTPDFKHKGEALAWAASVTFAKVNDLSPFLEPLGSLFEMMGNGDHPSDKNLQNPLLRGLFRYATQAAVPGIVQDTMQYLDPIQKDLKDMNDFMMSHVPGWGAEVNRDAFGRVRSLGYGFDSSMIPNTVRFLSGHYIRPENMDPVDKEVLRLGLGVRERNKVRGADLNAKQKNELLKDGGQRAYDDVKEFISSDSYKELNDNGRTQIIKRIIYDAYDIAAGRLIARDKDLKAEILKTAIEERTIRP